MLNGKTTISAVLDDAGTKHLRECLNQLTAEDWFIDQLDVTTWSWRDILENKDQIIAIPMDQLPFILPDGWIKTAVLSRMPVGYTIYFQQVDPNVSIVKALQQSLSVKCCDAYSTLQCLFRFPQWRTTTDAKSADALILPSCQNSGLPNYQRSFDFNPMEFIPPPSQGIICLVCHEDEPFFQKTARQLMDRDTAMCSNIERGILKLKQDEKVQGDLLAFAEKTASGFDISAALHKEGRWTTCMESYSTAAGAAAKIWRQLND